LLFTYFLDTLISTLSPVPGFEIALCRSPQRRLNVNGLFYADDIAIIVFRENHLRRCLSICEAHSVANNYRFAPIKCLVVPPHYTPAQFSLYGSSLMMATSFPYLGIPFTTNGMDIRQHLTNVIAKTRRAANSFRIIGFHGRGLAPSTNIRIYTTFIRPSMEYGLGIRSLWKKQQEWLDQTQYKILRQMLSLSGSPSGPAIHLACAITPMHMRASHLLLRTMARFHDASDNHLVHHLIQMDLTESVPRSTYRRLETMPLWKALLTKVPQSGRPQYLITLRQSDLLDLDRQSELLKLQSSGVIAGNISLLSQPHPIFFCPPYITRSQHRRMIQCLLGVLLGKPRPCAKCSALTLGTTPPNALRRHVIQCLGLGTLLKDLLDTSDDVSFGKSSR